MPVLYLPIYVPGGGEAGGTAHSQPQALPSYPPSLMAAAAAAAAHTSPTAPHTSPIRPLYLPTECQSPVGGGNNPRAAAPYYPSLDCRAPSFGGFIPGSQNPRIFSANGEPVRSLASTFSTLSLSDAGEEGRAPGKEKDGGGGGCSPDDIGIGAENGEKNRLLKYKTQLCRWHLSLSYCPHGVNCLFAHGLGELREVRSHSLYKTKPCRNYHLLGACAYADKCRYYHDANEKRASGCDKPERLSESASNGAEVIATELLKRDCDNLDDGHSYPNDMIGAV